MMAECVPIWPLVCYNVVSSCLIGTSQKDALVNLSFSKSTEHKRFTTRQKQVSKIKTFLLTHKLGMFLAFS